MQKYRVVDHLGGGAFGEVTKAINSSTNEVVAIKMMKRKFATWDECLKLRELRSLKVLNHENIVKLKEVIREEQKLYFVFEYCDTNLLKYLRQHQQADACIPEARIREIMYQILSALAYMHKHGFFHRDIKPENLLLRGNDIKIADFGLAREVRSRPPYTDYVATRWYRAPELILRLASYNSPVDMWAAGCIMAELYTTNTLFPGSSEADEMFRICHVLGTPTKQAWPEGFAMVTQMQFRFPSCSPLPLNQIVPNASQEALNLIKDLLQYDPSKRPTAAQCFRYPYFTQHDMSNSREVGDAGAKASSDGTESGSCLLIHRDSVLPEDSRFNSDGGRLGGEQLLRKSGSNYGSYSSFSESKESARDMYAIETVLERRPSYAEVIRKPAHAYSSDDLKDKRDSQFNGARIAKRENKMSRNEDDGEESDEEAYNLILEGYSKGSKDSDEKAGYPLPVSRGSRNSGKGVEAKTTGGRAALSEEELLDSLLQEVTL